ncbi:MAG: hypothetical protein GX638_17510 [Crenarchaeota archaeon]|nr:hypothetical protein [Thermoproteota archaeon]
MKKLLIDLMIVLLMLIGFDISIAKIGDYLLEHVEDTSFYGEIKYAITELSPEILILGASNAKSHYVPKIFMDSLHMATYNAGSDGKNILYHSCILNAVIQRNHPKLVVLELGKDEFESDFYDRLSVLNPFYSYDSLIRETVNLKSKTEWMKMKSYLYRYNSRIITLLYNCYKKGENKDAGYRALPYGGDLPVLDTIKIEGEVDRQSVDRFNYVLNISKKNNIPIIVAVSPYYGIIDKETKSMKIMKSLCKQNNIPFLNNIQSAYFLQHPEYFRDVNHLNHKGAEIYTKMIIKDIDKTNSKN